MSNKQGPDHVVVDGSNLATEGRSMPSLAQLSEAVGSFMDEYPDTAITVVVDATFGHRIDKKEVKEFEEGIANNELVAPPAGAVGRGDAFVLGIADKANSSVLSNDSFQEFHGEYAWLFDDGRLIGGKPVPHVGWVWVERVPVRGPVSRKATRGQGNSRGRSSGGGRSRRGGGGRDNGGRDDSTVRTGSKEASAPMPTPKTPPPGRSEAAATSDDTPKSGAKASRSRSTSNDVGKPAPKGDEAVNELMPFLEFVENQPVGSDVDGVVDAYSSHGAYVTLGDTGVRGYIPLRLMASPTPRSAKSIMKIGDTVSLVVVSFAAARRSIDCALPAMAADAIAEAEAEADADGTADVTDTADEKSPATRSRRRSSTRSSDVDAESSASDDEVAKKPSRKREATKKTAATRKSAATGASAKKSTSKRTAAKKSAAKKTTASKQSPAKKTATTKTTAAKKPTAKKTAAKKTTAAKKSPAKKTAAKKTAAKKAPAKKTAAKKAAAKKTATKKSAAKKAAAKKTATKKTAESTD